MRSKLAAARLVTQAGGSVDHRLGDAARAADPDPRRRGGRHPVPGPRARPRRARKRWIGLTARPRGHYVVDAGARRALESGSKSLLAIGVVEVVGEFEKGDVVGIRDPDGHEFARGLTNYATADARQIRGLRTEQARQALGDAALRRGHPPRQPRPDRSEAGDEEPDEVGASTLLELFELFEQGVFCGTSPWERSPGGAGRARFGTLFELFEQSSRGCFAGRRQRDGRSNGSREAGRVLHPGYLLLTEEMIPPVESGDRRATAGRRGLTESS